MPKLPVDLETICLKCLEKKPGKRYASAESLADDLRRFRTHEPIQARPVGLGERGLKWAVRRPAAAGLILVTSLASIVLVAGLTIGMATISAKQRQTTIALGLEHQARGELDRALRQVTEEQKQTKAALNEKALALDAKAAALDQAERVSYYQRISLADHSWSTGKIAEAENYLNACPVKLREWEWHYLKRLCDESLLSGYSEGNVGSVAFSPDGKRLAVKGHSAKVWDVAAGTVTLDLSGLYLRGHTNIAFSPDGLWLASGGESDDQVAIRDAANGRILRTFPHDRGELSRVAFHPDGKLLAANGSGNDVKIWNLTTGQEQATLRGHGRPVINVAFSPDGEKLASISEGKESWEIKVWDVRSSQVLRTLGGVYGRTLAFSPDSLHLAAANREEVKVFDLASGAIVVRLRGHTAAINSVDYGPDGRRIVSGGEDQTVRIWDTSTGEELLMFRGHREGVKSVAFHPGGQLVASVSDEKVKMWDATTGQEARALRGPHYLYSLAVDPKGPRIILIGSTGLDDKTSVAQLCDMNLGRAVRAFPGVFDSAFSPGGRRLALAEINQIRVIDLRTGQNVHTILVPIKDQRYWVRLSFSPDGRHLAAAPGLFTQRPEIAVADLETGKHQTIPGSFAAFHPDGRRLAIADGHLVKLWDREQGREISTFRGYQARVSCVAFSPDGRLLATATGPFIGDPCEIKVWDLGSGQEVYLYRSANRGINSLAFSPNGRRLAVDIERSGGVGHLGEVKLWDVTTWHEVLTLRGTTTPALGGHVTRCTQDRTRSRLTLLAVQLLGEAEVRDFGNRR
ncbi:hypothetical protein AYO40_03840 [Planctomycetaceae bacterium SCGC AG-212-D15]|nr:hypothetical protein AYO40_03840 [Planctomycetaceae bacterium SCGC AG-212-D15]